VFRQSSWGASVREPRRGKKGVSDSGAGGLPKQGEKGKKGPDRLSHRFSLIAARDGRGEKVPSLSAPLHSVLREERPTILLRTACFRSKREKKNRSSRCNGKEKEGVPRSTSTIGISPSLESRRRRKKKREGATLHGRSPLT